MRKVYPVPALACCLFVLSGCHAGSGNASPASSPRSNTASAQATTLSQVTTYNLAPESDHRTLLVCFGDSLTAGAGTGPGESYPDYLQSDLDRLHIHYRVDNQGVSGDTTKDGVARLPEVLALHPAVVVVEFGGNDGLRGLPIADTRANLDQIVATLQHAGIQVALAGITLPPDYGHDYIRQFNQTYTLLARKYRVPLLSFLLKNVYGVPGMMQSDRTHATAKGNQVVARNILALILPLLKK